MKNIGISLLEVISANYLLIMTDINIIHQILGQRSFLYPMKTSKLKVFGCFPAGKEQEHNPKMGFEHKTAQSLQEKMPFSLIGK